MLGRHCITAPRLEFTRGSETNNNNYDNNKINFIEPMSMETMFRGSPR